MPTPYAPQPPSHVGLFLGGMRYDVAEYSTAGLTLHRTSFLAPLDTLRRGEPCPATLQVHGEMYGVVLRFAAQGPHHVEFSFVSLAAQARGALEHYADSANLEGTGRDPEVAPSPSELPGPMALAFSRLAESIVPEGKRFIMPESESVYTVTLERRAPTPEPPAATPSAFDLAAAPALEGAGGGPRELFAYGLAFVLAVALILLLIVA